MESKKDIGNYFKENLESLDYSPSLKVWEGIEVELNKKKKRRIIFWMFCAVMAILGLSTYIYLNHSNFVIGSTNNIVTTDSDSKNSKDRNSNSNDIDYKKSDSNRISPYNTILKNTKKTERIKYEKTSKNNPNGNSVVTINSKKGDIKNKSTKLKRAKSDKSINALLQATKSGKRWEKLNKSNSSNRINDISKNNSLNALKTAELDVTSASEKEMSHSYDLKNADRNPIVTSDNNKKLSLEDLKKANQIKRDSLIAARKTEKEKKDILQQPKEEEKDSTKTEIADSSYEIIIAPYFGYNYNGNLGNGNFLNNSTTTKKDSQFQSTYGILVRWMESEKMGIQTGIGIINATYSATFEKKSNNFINPQNVSLDIPLSDINQLFLSNDTINTIVTATNKLSFIEVPLECYYVFADRKFGFAAAGGISFMISQKKDFFLESDNVERLKVGELKNILPFSVTGNIKLNLFYKISSKLQFDLYPEFQYHLMEFKEVSNYHSYYFSIKTGLSYKL